jgi:hypothetical protein
MGDMLLLWLARAADDWLWWNDMAEVGFVEKMMGRDVVGVGFIMMLFLLAKDVDSLL